MSLFRRKPIETDLAKDTGLKRVLTAFDLTLLGVGAIIGAGIFVLTGRAAAVEAGPAITLAFVVAGIACTCAALAYAELGIAQARRAWLTKEQVLNTRPWREIERWAKRT